MAVLSTVSDMTHILKSVCISRIIISEDVRAHYHPEQSKVGLGTFQVWNRNYHKSNMTYLMGMQYSLYVLTLTLSTLPIEFHYRNLEFNSYVYN